MNARLRILPAILGCLVAAAPAIAQDGAKLAVGPDAGGYLCPDGRQLYVKSCYDNSPNANCGVVHMHLPLNRGQWQVVTTDTRSSLIASVASCKIYPLEFRDGIVSLVLPKSAPSQQTAKAPAATPAPKPSTAATPPTTDDKITVVDGMAIGHNGVHSSLVRISTPRNPSFVVYVDEASRRSTGQKDIVAIWLLEVWPDGNPSAASVSAVWTELNANCKQNSYELTVGILLDRQANVLGTEAMNSRGIATKDPTKETPFSIVCKTTPPSKGPRFASAVAAIADAIAGAAPKTVAKPAAPAAQPTAKAPPVMARTRPPETETEKKFFQAVKENRLQAAVNAIISPPGGKPVPVAELADNEGMTALHWATANRNLAGIRWLLDKESEVDLADKKGRTPLKIALDNKDTRTMTFLLNRGADAKLALPGHDDQLKGFKKASELAEFLISAAVPASN